MIGLKKVANGEQKDRQTGAKMNCILLANQPFLFCASFCIVAHRWCEGIPRDYCRQVTFFKRLRVAFPIEVCAACFFSALFATLFYDDY